ncbi:MAG TPA: AsmA-like C-terminal region-containing protein, partial [Gammaproteobacteria bacterium]|nr:AsmA-like C-terminal region-containing protein [Gammaproteobacteria bacterium]
LEFASGGGLDAQGYLGATRRFALQFDAGGQPAEGYVFRRGALRFGGALPEFRLDRGVTVDGSLPVLKVDEWLKLARSSAAPVQWNSAFAGAALEVADFSVFGQQLGSSRISARRRTDDWQIEIDSGRIAGTLLVPAQLDRDPRIVAVMRRLYLNAGNGASLRELDPRELPGLQLHSDEFAIGSRQLGRLDAEILSDPLGLRLVSFESMSGSFSAEGSGGWFTGADGDTTRFAVSLSSSDVAATLEELGFDPVIDAEQAEVTASVFWPGPPSRDWMQHVSGDLALHAETGSLLDVQPGAGRMVGLLSISALPRRLALDFRDVFNKGFVFDEITADFAIIDGDAYTDNLKLSGPAAEIGVVGRTGLRDRDYRQQAVVTAEPGKMLPTVAGLLAGPGVAAAILIFTRIFKEPLKGIGRASYCVTGSWQEPVVERLTPEQLEQGELCAELPPGAATASQAGVAAR